ncbi:DUF2061 domain-containing protein [Pelagerythrobacter rhizovicinus]|uniref:DUF2061 domain-containing protein n=2 Tax=Pelagerythrobacter rhizovicinus TaxID=2268576 RepID=A0A4Q2KQ74_9SPHN|nr:DUF2061 domain-containing protein [Pelagerythrobacter rhizovicinus]
MHLIVAVMVAYALTWDWRKALAIGLIEPFVQTFAFAVHDRYWRRREHGSPISINAVAVYPRAPVNFPVRNNDKEELLCSN